MLTSRYRDPMVPATLTSSLFMATVIFFAFGVFVLGFDGGAARGWPLDAQAFLNLRQQDEIVMPKASAGMSTRVMMSGSHDLKPPPDWRGRRGVSAACGVWFFVGHKF